MEWITAGLGPASFLEIGWSLIVAVGLRYTLGCLRESWTNYRVVIDTPGTTESARMLAWSSIESERVNTLIQCCFLTAGLLAAVTPPRPDPYADGALLASVTLPFLIVIAEIGIVFNSYRRRQLRSRLLIMLAEEAIRIKMAALTDGAVGGVRSTDVHVPRDPDDPMV